MPYIKKDATKNKFDKPNIHARDMYGYIASITGLSVPQVRSCFQAYYQMLHQIATSDCVDLGLKIPLPHIGNFYFSKHMGCKKGSTYSNVDYLNGVSDQRVAIRDKDEPNYYALKFSIFNSLKKDVKKNTKNFKEIN